MSFFSPSRPDWIRFLTLLVWLAIGASAAGLLGSWNWLADLTAHFRVYYFLFLVPAAGVLFAIKRFKTAALALLVALALFPGFLPYYLPPQAAPADAPVLKVASINVLSSNQDHETVLKEIREQDPDLIFFMEVNEAWKDRLMVLKEMWPHVLAWEQEDNFGVLFLSKIPWESANIRFWGSVGVPSVEARFQWQNRSLTVMGIHPVPPVGAGNTRFRDEQLDEVADEIRKQKGPVVVLGDFNTTPWAPSFSRFIERSGLRDGARGFGIQCTWRHPLGVVLIPIDHVCVSPGIAVKRFKVGSEIGSDHLPVFAELALPIASDP